MTIKDMIEKRAKVWETAKNFVDTHENENGVLSAEDNATYSRMEQEIEDLTAAIDRQQRAEAREAALNQPINTPLTGRPAKQVEEKTDKKGGKYLVFSAFSTEKDGEAFAFTWVRFIRFSTEREAFLAPKAGITAKGKLELSAYLDKLNIACRVEELAEWVKKEYNPQTQS